jgi:23S rRNA (cytidine1920-2'-O)/16S rRNA (cytidine1409-2'-O)-methyltransferase
VKDEAAQWGAVEKVRSALVELGYQVAEPIDSPILGTEGNREFLLYATCH